jgi:hypothetical protein
MATRETHQNIADTIRTVASEYARAEAPVLVPWRMEASQDHLHKGLELCGCGCTPPDDPKDETRP